MAQWPSLSSVTVSGCSHLKEILVRCRNVKVLQFLVSPRSLFCHYYNSPTLDDKNTSTFVYTVNVRRIGFQWLHISKFIIETPELEELDLKGSDFENFHLASQSLKQLEVSGLCTGSDVAQCNVDIK